MTRPATAADILQAGGGVTLHDALAVAFLPDEELRQRAARALRDPDAETPELRRLLAWRLERRQEPTPPRMGRPRTFDVDLAREFYRLRESGESYEAATEALSRLRDPFERPRDRTPGRKAKAALDEGRRGLREMAALLEEVRAVLQK